MRTLKTSAVSRGPLLLMGAGIFLLVLLGTFPLTRWAYADWTAVSAASRESLIYAGPWSAAFCAWIASRYLGSRSMLCLPSASRSGSDIVVAQIVEIAPFVLGSYVLGLCPALVWTAVNATYGSVDWLVLLGSATVLVLFCSLGYLIGCVAGRVVSVIFAVATSFVLILLVDTLGPVLAPLRLALTTVGTYETTTVAIFRILFYSAVAAAMIAASASVVARRTLPFRISAYVGMTWLFVPLALALIAHSTAPPVVAVEENPPMACARAASVDVCVHSAKSSMLPALISTIDGVLSIVDGQPAVPISTIYDGDIRRMAPSGALILDLQGAETPVVWTGWVATDVATYISGQRACSLRGDTSGAEASEASDHFDVSTGIATWLVRASRNTDSLIDSTEGSEAVAQRMDELSDSEARLMYQDLSVELGACQLSSGSLP